MRDLGLAVLAAGLLVALAGAAILLFGSVGMGRLPGDVRFGAGRVSVYLPLGTSIVLSLLLTLLLNLLLRR